MAPPFSIVSVGDKRQGCIRDRDGHHHVREHQSNFSVLAGIADVFPGFQ